MDTPEDGLSIDFARLAERVHSEQGIPMFLACENLVPDETAEEPAPVTLAPLNKNLASAFRRDSDAFQRIRHDAPVMDVCKIVETLADRDFAAGGAEKQL